jgi:hypothetical protein
LASLRPPLGKLLFAEGRSPASDLDRARAPDPLPLRLCGKIRIKSMIRSRRRWNAGLPVIPGIFIAERPLF